MVSVAWSVPRRRHLFPGVNGGHPVDGNERPQDHGPTTVGPQPETRPSSRRTSVTVFRLPDFGSPLEESPRANPLFRETTTSTTD